MEEDREVRFPSSYVENIEYIWFVLFLINALPYCYFFSSNTNFISYNVPSPPHHHSSS